MSPVPKHIKSKNQIRRYRKKRNLKLKHIAKSAGLKSVSHVAHWERGRKLPSLKNALKLSAIIKCPVEILFFELFDFLRNQILNEEKTNQSTH